MTVSLKHDEDENEDEYDLKIFDAAMKEYQKNPVTYSLDEVEKELDA